MSKQKQPNILVIRGDDIGISNLSCYSHGLMGYRTPNIDRIAKEGVKFAETFKEFPSIQKPNTFTIDDAIAKMSEAGGGGSH